ncbi:MAG: hypothetical protein IT184_03315 [Acidobacteria bacterium]|nr:hypothetical protein [Acidobacteriota bacterium]
MRWQKPARVIVAVIGLGTAAAIVLLTKDRPAVAPQASTTPADPAASYQSGAGETVRHEGNRLVARLEYGQVRRYDDRMEWDDFALELEDGASLTARRVKGTFAGANREQPSVFTAEGDVRFRSPDGAALEGDAGTYDDTNGMASIPGPATITRGRMTGRGRGGTYERNAGAFKLLAEASLTIAPEGGGTPIDASAGTITVVAGGSTLLLEQRARIGRESETLTADRATVYLADGQQQLRTIELRGHARVQPVPGRTSDMPDLQAQDLELDFHEDGTALRRGALHRQAVMTQRGGQGTRVIRGEEISFRMAPDGATLTRLDASQRVSVTLPPSATNAGRTITGATLAASGSDQAGLTAAVFDGGVEFTESAGATAGRPASRRTGRSQRLSLAVKGQLDMIDAALFERDVTFKSQNMTGTADIGEYRAGQAELELRPGGASGRRARVEDGQVIVEALERIVVDLDSNDLYARRGVTTVSRSAGAGRRSAMFDASQPLYGTGAEFWYEAGAERFRYAGDAAARAQLKQSDDSFVLGRDIVFLQPAQDLSATGQVESVFAIASGTSTTSTRYRATAATFHYEDEKRTVTYTGAPATLKSHEDETVAAEIVLTLTGEGRTLERLEATGNVRTSVEQGRQALGDRLLYDAVADVYRLWGKPLTLWTRDADGTCTSQTGNFVRIGRDVRAPEFPVADNPAGATSTSKQACPAFLAAGK